MAVVVYMKPNNAPSESVLRDLEAHGIEVIKRNVTNREHLKAMKALGYHQAPVTVIDTVTHWAGYLPHKILECLID